mmetsp:Transcript_53451/g.149300  ORF Transcript_53451/g.149300 Transcript_53451/m.149300 type:complete len:239 (-) Transcript_53451:120-836(-)
MHTTNLISRAMAALRGASVWARRPGRLGARPWRPRPSRRRPCSTSTPSTPRRPRGRCSCRQAMCAGRSRSACWAWTPARASSRTGSSSLRRSSRPRRRQRRARAPHCPGAWALRGAATTGSSTSTRPCTCSTSPTGSSTAWRPGTTSRPSAAPGRMSSSSRRCSRTSPTASTWTPTAGMARRTATRSCSSSPAGAASSWSLKYTSSRRCGARCGRRGYSSGAYLRQGTPRRSASTPRA